MKRTCAAGVVIACLVYAPLAGQSVPGAPGQIAAPEAAGLARVEGRVIAGDTGAPLARARVRILNGSTIDRVTETDGEGRYAFRDLPPGGHSLFAEKPGYVTMRSRQRTPLDSGGAVRLAAGETLSNVDFVLPRGGVITGRITDEFGDAIVQAPVQALRMEWAADGSRRPVRRADTTTDDRGGFRLYGLTPGDYIVTASGQGMFVMSREPPTSDPYDAFGPTYYPGTPNPAEAQVVRVDAGQDVPVQFALWAVRTRRVSGVVLGATGEPLGGVMLDLRSGAAPAWPARLVGQARADGAFTLDNVPPGEYAFEVRTSRPGAPLEAGRASIVVADRDLEGIVIRLTKAATVSGVVVFDGTSNRPPRNGARVLVLPTVDDGSGVLRDESGNGAVIPDGSFTISGVVGRVLFMPATPGWALKSVWLDGRDITDVPLDVAGREEIADLRIVVTDRPSRIAGRVSDASGRPLQDVPVFLQRTSAPPGLPPDRRLFIARTDEDGRFEGLAMLPGTYVATAIEWFEQGRQNSPEFLQQLRTLGREFSLQEGQSVILDLRMAPGP